MASALYNREILALAASLIHDDHLQDADGTAQMRAPLCGSRMEVDVKINANGMIEAAAFRANACALGQASAAILQHHAAGQDENSLHLIKAMIASYYDGTGEMTDAWPELGALKIAKDFPARHGAILLPYITLIEAMQMAKKPV